MNTALRDPGITYLLFLAKEIIDGKIQIAAVEAPPLARRLIEVYESPFCQKYLDRRDAANAAGVLATKSPAV